MPKVIVYHSYYGCDTGCCGHVIELQDDNGNRLEKEFEFSCPDRNADFREFAEDLVRQKFGEEHVADLDWANCEIVSD